MSRLLPRLLVFAVIAAGCQRTSLRAPVEPACTGGPVFESALPAHRRFFFNPR